LAILFALLVPLVLFMHRQDHQPGLPD